MLLFLVAVGLTLIFGLMDVINLTHGSLFMIGAYVALSVIGWTHNFLIAAIAGSAAALLIGIIIERALLQPFYARGHLDQVLLTLGLVYVFADASLWIWGTDLHSMPEPRSLERSISVAGISYPSYRLFIVAFGLLLGAAMWYLERRTLYGAILRAGVADREMVSALGINVRNVLTAGFALGALLAGLAGALGAPIIGVFPGVDSVILITSLVVVVIGGLGTLGGSFWGSLLVGLTQTFGAVLLPQFSLFVVYALMAAILLFRPRGLLGRNLR
jgi:branched-chain amino acid transport system permease protein